MVSHHQYFQKVFHSTLVLVLQDKRAFYSLRQKSLPHCHFVWVLHFHLSGSSLSCFDQCKKIWSLTRGDSVQKENTGTGIFKAAYSQQIQNILYMGPSDQEKENTLMCTCLHASGALAEHFAHNIPGFTLWVKCRHPYKNFSEFCALCFNLHSQFFINSSSLWHQKLKRKRENSTSRYEEAVICKAVFQTRHTFAIKTCLALQHHARNSP